jgi:hypothetical protein
VLDDETEKLGTLLLPITTTTLMTGPSAAVSASSLGPPCPVAEALIPLMRGSFEAGRDFGQVQCLAMFSLVGLQRTMSTAPPAQDGIVQYLP